MANHWDQYWQQGFLTSFCGDYLGNYQDEFRRFWIDAFRNESISAMLDVATGNLSIPLLAVEKLPSNADIYATDLAHISKDLIAKKNKIAKDKLARINLRTGESAEELEYPSNSFDLVTSMFGFEYANKQKAIQSIAQVMKKGGKFIAIAHYENSLIIKKNKHSMSCLKEILYKQKFFNHFINLSKVMGDVRGKEDLYSLKFNKKAEKIRKKINDSLHYLESKYGEVFLETGIFDFVQYFFGRGITGTVKNRAAIINSKLKELEIHLLRLKDLIGAAFTEKELEQIDSIAVQHNMKVTKKAPFYKGQDLVAIELELVKLISD